MLSILLDCFIQKHWLQDITQLPRQAAVRIAYLLQRPFWVSDASSQSAPPAGWSECSCGSVSKMEGWSRWWRNELHCIRACGPNLPSWQLLTELMGLRWSQLSWPPISQHCSLNLTEISLQGSPPPLQCQPGWSVLHRPVMWNRFLSWFTISQVACHFCNLKDSIYHGYTKLERGYSRCLNIWKTRFSISCTSSILWFSFSFLNCFGSSEFWIVQFLHCLFHLFVHAPLCLH